MSEKRTARRAHSAGHRLLPSLSFLWVGVATVILIAWISTVAWSAHLAIPRFMNGFYSVDGGDSQPFRFPLSFPSIGRNVTIDFDMESPWMYRPILWVSADDCIVSMRLNGENTQPQNLSFPFCSPKLQAFRLHDSLKKTINHFTVSLEDRGGLATLNVELGRIDSLVMLFWILALAGVLAWIGACSRSLRWQLADAGVAGIVAFGILLRCLYVAAPPAAGDWAFHQPPQIIPLAFTILTLLTGVAIAYALFRGQHQGQQRLLFSALVAVFPASVMLSSRITNDVLVQFLSFLFVLCLIRFWQHRLSRDFWTQTMVLAAASLTKVSAVLFLPISILCTLSMRGVSLGRKLRWIAMMAVICIFVAGLLPILRFAMEVDTTRSVVLGNEGMNPMVALKNTPAAFLTFNPLEVFRHPFNNPRDDNARLQFFPEYFYKSAFFGESGFPSSFRTLGFLILLLGFASLLMGLFGVLFSLMMKLKDAFPLFLVLILQLAAIVGYRFLFPYAPNQDFRFVTVLTIPWFYFALVGASALPPAVRRLLLSILWAWAAVCGLFFLKIFFDPPFQ